MKRTKAILIFMLALSLLLLCGCGSTSAGSAGSDSGYQRIDLVMAVNGTDTQIDSRVARYFAELVEERSGGNVTVSMPGGELGVSLTRTEDGVRDIFLIGPTCLVYEAELTEELLEGVCRTF